MATCKECGKKGLFLKLNARGLCPDCAEKAKAAPRSGQFTISIGGVNAGAEYASIGHGDEEAACQYFIDELVKRGKDKALFKIDHRAADYTSLVYDEFNDFIRIKMTDNVCWISLALTNDDQKAHMDDPLFSSQADKGKRHWRSDFDDIGQLERYLELAENACHSIPLGTPRDVTEKEKIIADYLYDLFIKCGAEPEYMYYYTLANEFELLYRCGAGAVRFKAYARKPGGYINIDRDFEAAKIKGEKYRFAFSELSELDCLAEKLIPIKINNGIEYEKYSKEHYTRYEK